MARVFATSSLPGAALGRLAAEPDLAIWPGESRPTPAQLRAGVAGAQGLLCLLGDRIDAALLDAAPGLRAVANYAVGVDNVDLGAAAARGIAVGNTPDVLTDSTADLAIALMLAVARRMPEGLAAARDGAWGAWSPEWLLGRDLSGATLGIVGMGRIGEAVARRAEGFGMEVLHGGRRAGDGLGLEELLERSDFVSLHCPLTPLTRGLVGAAELRRMRPESYLVNTARGPIVDQEALLAALSAGEIAGAGLDVTDPEPLPADDPLLGAPNLVLLPHLGSATRRTRAAMADRAVDNLLAALAGAPMPYPVG